ncbi:MAG: hypothetical protein JXA50_07620 [Deltaproteobacteria bacterium]|nr:hypothetical protein [Deltaproteobacteria bacterium]
MKLIPIVPDLRRVVEREFEIIRRGGGSYIHKEGMDGIESFVKGMIIVSLAQKIANHKTSCRVPFSGVQSKQPIEDSINNKPISRRR